MIQESWKAAVAAIEEQQSALDSLAEVVLQNIESPQCYDS